MEAHGKHTVVLIDDEEVIRYSLQKKLSRFGYHVISLERAEDALFLLKNEKDSIDVIITDVKLPKMDGIELLRHINIMDDPIPVLIITGQGNIEDAIKALRYGARDFVRKPFDINEVASIVRGIIKSEDEKQVSTSYGRYLQYDKQIFKLPVDITASNVISHKLTENLHSMGLCNQTTAGNLSLALHEAISNAMYHGNLEIPSIIREDTGIRGFNEEVEKRKNDEQYGNRMVTIQYELTSEFVEYIVEDEGPGFDYTTIPDARDPENFFKNSGRGLLIIRIHFDEVEWNTTGNRIRLRKNKVETNHYK